MDDQQAFDYGASWSTAMTKLQLLDSLFDWSKIAAKHVKEPLQRRNYEIMRSSMGDADDELSKWFSELTTTTEHVTSLYLAEAAIVVFAHSILDELINNALAVSVKQDISIWQERILEWSKAKAKFSLVDFQATTFIDLLEKESKRYLNHLKGRSLPNRTKVLLGVLQPSAEMVSGHGFKLTTLEKLTTLRNTLIHEELLGQTLAVDDAFLNELLLTGYFIHQLIMERHNLNVVDVSEGMTASSLTRYKPHNSQTVE